MAATAFVKKLVLIDTHANPGLDVVSKCFCPLSFVSLRYVSLLVLVGIS